MIVNATIKVKQIDKSTRKVEVYSPSFSHGAPLLTLPGQYEGVPVKLVTGWADIPQQTPMTINGGIINDSVVGKCQLARGMFLTAFGDSTVYVVTPAQLL